MIIACATDRAFVQPTCVMLASLSRSGGLGDIPVFVFGLGLRPSDHAAIRQSYRGHALSIVDLTSDTALLRHLPITRFVPSRATYARLLIPGLLDDEYSRMLYLDVDIVIQHDLTELIAIPLGDNVIAAVRDQEPDARAISYRFNVLGIMSPLRYFNAGMMLVDLPAWKKQGVTEQSFALYQRLATKAALQFGDQDLLNAVLQDRWLEIERCWNFFQRDSELSLSVDDFKIAKIIHFASPNKPWIANSVHPAKYLYLENRLRTPFAEARLQSELEKKLHLLRRVPRQIVRELISRLISTKVD